MFQESYGWLCGYHKANTTQLWDFRLYYWMLKQSKVTLRINATVRSVVGLCLTFRTFLIQVLDGSVCGKLHATAAFLPRNETFY